MKESVVVAAVQMDVARLDPEKNRERMAWFVDKIMAERHTDLVIFPELANVGYVKEFDVDFGSALHQAAERIPGPTTEVLCAKARAYGIHIVAGLCQLHPTIPAMMYNASVLIGPHGDILGIYHKIHLALEEKHYFRPGSSIEVYPTEIGNLGLIICYDLVFPELARLLALKGAEIVCACFNAPRRDPFVADFLYHLAATRANENKNYVVICNRVGVEDGLIFYGRSVVGGPRAELLARSADEEEEILYVELTRKLFNEGRAKNIFIDRRPELYSLVAQA
jgi:predicted amidohydrolase